MAKTLKPASSSSPTEPTAADTGIRATFHPLWTFFQEEWTLLAHVREGSGGFRDGTFLVAHPREWEDYTSEAPTKPTKKLKARRSLACYENFAASILDAKKTALFRETPNRRVSEGRGPEQQTDRDPSDLEQWWQNVDGCGTAIDDYLSHSWDLAATFGVLWLYLDRPKGAPAATAADVAAPFLRVYSPLDLIDWIVNDRGEMTQALFREAVVRSTFTNQVDGSAYQLRHVTPEYWAVYDQQGQLLEGGPVNGLHRLGVLPVVPLFAQRRALRKHVGQSVLGDPKAHVDLFNLTSEIRELLRNQTFSFINIPLGTGDQAMTVEKAKEMLGGQTGAMNVIFSGAAAQILSGQADNVTVYHQEFERRLRNIYRQSGVGWESDSKDAEAEGSLKLKREDMNTRLAFYADELEKTDYALARLFYRAMYGAEAGQQKFDEARVSIRYPDTFDMTPFEEVLKQAQGALTLGFPAIVLKAIRKALLSKFLPDLTPEQLVELLEAIEAAEDDPTPMEKMKAKLAITAGAAAAGGKKEEVAPADGEKPAVAA